MTTIENNKLIAEFLGFQETNIGWYDAEETLLGLEADNTFDTLKFHKDWNWVWAVVEKIESLGLSFEINRQEEGDYQFLFTKGNDIKFQTFSSIKFEAVYKAIVEFIKWYNKQK